MKNREIKFRGQVIDTCQWIYGYLVINPDETHRIYLQYTWFYVLPESVGQFTGLLDTNGTEIYEGDIFKWKKSIKSSKGFIEYREDGFRCIETQNKRSTIYVWPLISMYEHLTIIGNIYQNPEMIEP